MSTKPSWQAEGKLYLLAWYTDKMPSLTEISIYKNILSSKPSVYTYDT
jgi:hypothetical protein